MTPEQRTGHTVRRGSRWTAPASAMVCLAILAVVDTWWTFTRPLRDLRIHDTESKELAGRLAQASSHVTATANVVFYTTMLLVAAAGLAGIVRPVRHGGWYLLGLTGAALVAVWVATRADVSFIHAFG